MVAQQIAASLPAGSLGIVYDCFGSGKYRNESEPRHRAYDALAQMANEMATLGLCHTLIASPNTAREELFRSFLDRAKQAICTLREVNICDGCL